jgi:Glycosyltransferase family 87
MNVKIRVAGIGIALAVLTMLVLLLVHPSMDPARIRPLPLVIAAWLAFLSAAWLLRKVALRASVALILLGGIAVQVAAVSAPPQNSTDLYRYIWDGKVQAAGIDPYSYSPASTHLDGLRNDFLWYPSAQYCVRHPSGYFTSGCTRINRPIVHTIYPPVAEAYFLGVHYLPQGSVSSTPIQATTAGFAVLTTVLLLFGLRRLRRDMRMAALWSWCPTVGLEAGNSAHVDVVAVGITAAALLLLATARTERRTVLGGVLLGLAIATKMTPALVLPAVLRRRWFLVIASAGTAILVVYAPHLFAVGSKVIGFIPGYLQQEGYNNGSRFGLIDLFVGGRPASAVAVLVLAAVALAVFRYADPDRPWRGAVVMTAAALAVATPYYQWYALLLVMLVALDGRPEWLAFAAGGYYAAEPDMGQFTVPSQYHNAVGYGIPVLIVVAGWLVRRHLARRTIAPLPVLRPQVEQAPVPTAIAPAATAPATPVAAAANGSTAPWPAAPMPATPKPAALEPVGPAAAIAAEEHAISAPPLRSILVDDPLPRRVRV